MRSTKKKRLEAKGWKVGTAGEFLQLSPEESAYIEMKLALSKNLQERRKDKSLTQKQLARLLKSSQSRVAKMETGDPSVSLDLLIRCCWLWGNREKVLLRFFPDHFLPMRVRPAFQLMAPDDLRSELAKRRSEIYRLHLLLKPIFGCGIGCTPSPLFPSGRGRLRRGVFTNFFPDGTLSCFMKCMIARPDSAH